MVNDSPHILETYLLLHDIFQFLNRFKSNLIFKIETDPAITLGILCYDIPDGNMIFPQGQHTSIIFLQRHNHKVKIKFQI